MNRNCNYDKLLIQGAVFSIAIANFVSVDIIGFVGSRFRCTVSKLV